jgi:hypothetical protein
MIRKAHKYLPRRGDYMKETLKKSLFISFAIGFCFIVFNSIGIARDSGSIQPEDHLGSESSEIVSKHKYSCRYYPSCSVYYNIQKKLYYYPEDNNWEISAILPSNLKRKLGDYVKIETDKDKPYIENEKHVKKFPPENSSKTSNNIWSKLIFVLFFEHAPK